MVEPDFAERQARKRFMVINVVRIAGVAMILLGLLVASGSVDWPQWSAYVLMGVGMVDAFIFPTLLSRRWSTNDRR